MAQGVHVLLVEDDDADARAVQRGMRQHPAVESVQHCRNANAALAWLREDEDPTPRVQLIVLDLGLPGMSGVEFLNIVKHDFALAAIPVIVLSGRSDSNELMDVYQAGAAAFMSKPENTEGYKNLLDGILRFWTQAHLPRPSSIPAASTK